MIELLASVLSILLMMCGLAIGFCLKGVTPLTRTCGRSRFLLNISCLAGCSGEAKTSDNDNLPTDQPLEHITTERIADRRFRK